MRARRRLAALAGLAALQLLSCGGDPDDPCKKMDCTVPTFTVVKFEFNHYPEVGFDRDSCVDFGVGKVLVEAVDAANNVISAQDDCGNAQVTLMNLPAGDYTVYVTPLDFGGNALVANPVSGMVTAIAGMNAEVTVNIPWDAWLGTHTGTFLFRLGWEGASCAIGSMPITQQLLKLTIRGQVVSQVTDSGQKLDGTDLQPCRALTEGFPQSATNVPFGPGVLSVEGRGPMNLRWTHDFPVFNGAGISNPTITYTYPPDAMPDAPIDAAPDAPDDAADDAPID